MSLCLMVPMLFMIGGGRVHVLQCHAHLPLVLLKCLVVLSAA